MKRVHHERTMLAFTLVMLALATLLSLPSTVQAFDDDREQIARQLKLHEEAVRACLKGFGNGDEALQQSAQADLAASEAYLSVLDFPASDPRLAGHLFDEQLAASPANVATFSSRLFHLRLKQRTGFEMNYGAVLNLDNLSDAEAK
jgi:hypothetical protein